MGAVLDVLLDFLDAVADGESTEHALCMSLADRFNASAAALISFDAETSTVTVTAWPHTIDMVRMKFVLDRLADAFPLFMRQLLTDRRAWCLSASADPDSYRGTVAAMLVSEVLGCEDIAQVPLTCPGPLLRLVVLASRRAFDHQDMHVLDRLRDPLVATTRLAVRRSTEAAPTDAARVGAGRPDEPTLTAREIEVLRMVAQGLLARTIADRLDVSPRTVHKHLGNVYRKLGAHDRLMAVRRAEGLGLLSPRPHAVRSTNHTGVLTVKW